MKRALMLLLLAVWMIGGTAMVVGQDDPFFGHPTGCDAGTLDAIEDASPNVDYRAACEQFLACAAAGRYINVCQFEVAGRLLEACPADDVHCRNEALLHVAALTIYGPADYWSEHAFCVWDNGEQFPDVLHLFSGGDFDGAATLFSQMVADAQVNDCHPMFKYVDGLIDEARGHTESALQAYVESVAFSERKLTPAMYSRGLLLGELSRAIEASFDGEQLRRFLNVAAPVVLPVMAPLIEGYPLDMTPFTTWIAYQVATKSSNPGGTYLQDHTLTPSIPFQIAEYPELDRLVFLDFPTGDWRFPLDAAAEGLIRLDPISQQAGPYYVFNDSVIEGPVANSRYVGSSLGVEVSDDLTVAIRSASGFEAGSGTTYIAVPPDASDPRTRLGTRICEGGVLSLIRPGLNVFPVPDMYGLRLQAQPGDNNQDDERVDYARISGESVCIGTDAWWFATAPDGQTGWVRENRGSWYELTQSDLHAFRWIYCPEALPSKLILDTWAQVLDEPGAGEFREASGNDAALVATLSPGETVDLGYERACVDGKVWWRVFTEDGQSGYMPEGDSDTYFLEPIPVTP